MKNLRLLLILFACQVAASDHELFLQANSFYKNQDYHQALDTYRVIKNKNGVVWYNMGNCSYKLEDAAQALMYWHVAECGAPCTVRDDCNHNKHVALLKAPQENKTPLGEQVWEWCAYQSARVPFLWWQLSLIGLWFLLWYGIFYGRWRLEILVVLLLCSAFCAVSVAVKYQESRYHHGCIIQKGDTLFAGPHEQYHAIGSCDDMAFVAIEQQTKNWCQIRYKKLLGWMPRAKLELV